MRPGFLAMDFVTRDRYRHAIEDLAKGSQRPELEIARTVIASTQAYRAATAVLDERRADPGYYLISTGRAEFEQQIGFRVSLRQRVLRAYVANASFAYLGTIALLTVVILAVPLLVSARAGAPAGRLLPLQRAIAARVSCSADCARMVAGTVSAHTVESGAANLGSVGVIGRILVLLIVVSTYFVLTHEVSKPPSTLSRFLMMSQCNNGTPAILDLGQMNGGRLLEFPSHAVLSYRRGGRRLSEGRVHLLKFAL